MKFTHLLIGTLVLTTMTAANAQVQISTSNNWWAYLADYDGTPGATRVDMVLNFVQN